MDATIPLYRKASDSERLEMLEANVSRILALLTAREDEKRPPLTLTAFARAIGVSVSTVHRRVQRNQLRTVHGRIPYSELRKHLS